MDFDKQKQQERKRVLIIEDEVDLALLMKTYFLRKNYEVYIVHSLEAVFYQCGNLAPAIVLISSVFCSDKKATAEKIGLLFPDVELIICGWEDIYRNGDPFNL
jgi:CheY-like chemotaxis protein